MVGEENKTGRPLYTTQQKSLTSPDLTRLADLRFRRLGPVATIDRFSQLSVPRQALLRLSGQIADIYLRDHEQAPVVSAAGTKFPALVRLGPKSVQLDAEKFHQWVSRVRILSNLSFRVSGD